MRHRIVTHFYALAAVGNTLGIGWIVKEILSTGVAQSYGWVAGVGGAGALYYFLCYAIIADLRKPRNSGTIAPRRFPRASPDGEQYDY